MSWKFQQNTLIFESSVKLSNKNRANKTLADIKNQISLLQLLSEEWQTNYFLQSRIPEDLM